MSKFYSVLAILIVAIVSGAMSIFVFNAFQLSRSLEENIPATFLTDITNSPQITPQTNCNYSEWQTAVEERDNIIKQLNEDAVKSQEINQQWVKAEKQWHTTESVLRQEIITLQQEHTHFIKLIQQNTLDMIAKFLIDSTYDNSSYSILLRIAQTPLEQDLLLRALTTNAYSACQSLNSYVQMGTITAVPEYGEHCQKVKDLFNSLKE